MRSLVSGSVKLESCRPIRRFRAAMLAGASLGATIATPAWASCIIVDGYAYCTDGEVIENNGDVTTTGDSEPGLSAGPTDGLANIQSQGDIETFGFNSRGIEALGFVSTITSVGSVTTHGNLSGAIVANANGAHAIISSEGSIATEGYRSSGLSASGELGAIVVSVGDISTAGDESVGVGASSPSGEVLVQLSGNIATLGTESEAIHVVTDGEAILDSSASITTAGHSSPGILMEAGDGLVLSNSNITTAGDDSAGIHFDGDSGGLQSNGAISTSGNNSAGMFARGDDIGAFSNAPISTLGEGSIGIHSGWGIFPGQSTYSAGEFSISGNRLDVYCLSDNVTACVDAAVATSGIASPYVVSVHIISGDGTLQAPYGASNAAAGNFSTISTTGDFADGIRVEAYSGTATAFNQGDISVSGLGASAINVAGMNAVISSEGSITKTGDAAFVYEGGAGALMATSINGVAGTDFAIISNVGNITTEGNFSGGLMAQARNVGDATSSADALVESVGNISTSGYGADGIIAASATGLAGARSTGDITTLGDLAQGIYVSAAENVGVVENYGNISTSGVGSSGIAVEALQAVIISEGSISTTGEGTDAIVVGGAYLQVVDGVFKPNVNADYAQLDVTGSVSASGAGASGIVVAADEVHLAIDADIYGAAEGLAITGSALGTEIALDGGSISGGETGILLFAPSGGTASLNLAGGTSVSGGQLGIHVAGPLEVTIHSSGAISGGLLLGAGNDSLFLDTGAQFAGSADGGDGYDILVLAAGVDFVGQDVNFEGLEVLGSDYVDSDGSSKLAVYVEGGSYTQLGSLAADVATAGTGIFRLGDGGVNGNFTGNLVNDGTFHFNRSDDFDFTGDFSGTGTLIKDGAGTLSFLGDYSFSGLTILNAGGIRFDGLVDPTSTFDLADGTVLDLSGSNEAQTIAGLSGPTGAEVLIGAGGLTVDQFYDSEFAGSIEGDGGFTKTGDGRLNLTGTSTYTGETIVEDGTLSVNGSIDSPVIIQSGATLGGNGTTGEVTINEGGTFAPGNSIGTIAVAGNLTFDPGSFFGVEVNAMGQNDRIIVSGTVTIDNAGVLVLAEDGNYGTRTNYTILTAEQGVSGTFTSLSTNLAFLTPNLNYTGTAVTLTLTRNDTSFPSVALSRNQAAVANAAAKLHSKSPIFTSLLGLSAEGAQAAFSALSGEIYGNLSNALFSDANSLRAALSYSETSGKGIMSFGSTFSYRQVPAGSLFSSGRTNAVFGMADGSYTLGSSMPLGGMLLSVVTGRSGLNELAVSASESAGVSSEFIGGNIRAETDGFSLLAGGGLAWHEAVSERSIAFGEFADAATARFDATSIVAFAEVAYSGFQQSGVTPYVSLGVNRISIDSLAERGHLAALEVGGSTRTVGTAAVGLRASLEARLGDAWRLRPVIDAALRRNFGDLSTATQMDLAGTGEGFRIESHQLAATSLDIDAGVSLSRGRFGLTAGYRQGSNGFDRDRSATLAMSLAF